MRGRNDLLLRCLLLCQFGLFSSFGFSSLRLRCFSFRQFHFLKSLFGFCSINNLLLQYSWMNELMNVSNR